MTDEDTEKIDISDRLDRFDEENDNWESINNPADYLRNRDTEELIEIQDRLVNEMNDPHPPELTSMLSIIHSELLSRGEIGFRT